jgi:hypothetical protein
MNYNYNNGRFENKGAVNDWDNNNYLIKNIENNYTKIDYSSDEAPF